MITENKILQEIIHKGYSRAATSFSSMLGHKVHIDNNRIDLLKNKNELAELFINRNNLHLVETSVIGALIGESYLLFTREEEEAICKMCRSAFGNENYMENELILKEIDNILSAAVITEFANTLGIRIYGDVPHLFLVDNNEGFKEAIFKAESKDDYFILANANFVFDGLVSICPVFLWRFEKKLEGFIEAQMAKSTGQ